MIRLISREYRDLKMVMMISAHLRSHTMLCLPIGLVLVGYHNQFTGTEWVCPENIQLYNEPGFPCYRPGLPARLGIVEFGVAITVEVHPPSPHECAEALLSLSEWLNGKVSEQEKRELLQLPDGVEA